MTLAHEARTTHPPQVGLIVLQADETIESDMRRLLPSKLNYMVSRVPSGQSVTPDTLVEMAHHLTQAASLFPRGAQMSCVAYACTSGTAEIGADLVSKLVRDGVSCDLVTDPVTSLVAACRALDITRIALLSPYVAAVSDTLIAVLAQNGIEVVAFDSFDEPREDRVVRISTRSIVEAAMDLGQEAKPEALFLSCTNLRTLEAIPTLETSRGIPVLSSNLVLAWHIAKLAGQNDLQNQNLWLTRHA